MTNLINVSMDKLQHTGQNLGRVFNSYNETPSFEKRKQLLEYKNFIYLYTSVGQNSNLCLNVIHFSTQALIRHPWQHKTVVFMHRVLLSVNMPCSYTAQLNVENSALTTSRFSIVKY
jgi:hypothetical protein